MSEKKHANKRNVIQIAEDKKYIREQLSKGFNDYDKLLDEINKRYKKQKLNISISKSQIQYDLAKILKEIAIESEEEINLLRQSLLLQHYYVYQQASIGWEKSKQRNSSFLKIMLTTLSGITNLFGVNIKPKESDVSEGDNEEEVEESIETEIPNNNR